MKWWLLLVSLICSIAHAFVPQEKNCTNNKNYEVGAGIYDITGPAAEQGMMGYGMFNQRTAGILQRLWARAFVIASSCNQQRVVFVSADLCALFQGVKQQVIIRLKKKYGNLYNDDNVLLTATHSHSGPGGYSTYALYNLTTLGFSKKNFEVIVDGIVKAIERAHANVVPVQMRLAEGELNDITFNRSPSSYLENNEKERATYFKDIETDMLQLRFDPINGEPIGLINWFAVHGVSLNNKNLLISGDNKGYAAYLFEKDFNSNHGPHSFVSAFAQAIAGDVSPNPYGSEGGAGEKGLSELERVGRPQYEKAKLLYHSANKPIVGGVSYIHAYLSMDNMNFPGAKTCKAAIGMSMLAGTQDGEGVGYQGVTCDKITKIIPAFICKLTKTACQGEKPIVLETGSKKPHPWTPNILPLQIFKVGQLVVVGVPFELTTMTGRRIKQAVMAQLAPYGATHIVISTLANAYAGYVATREEYKKQRYEAASTHFGPFTEAVLVKTLANLAKALAKGEQMQTGPIPPDLSGSQIELQPGVIYDYAYRPFGSIAKDVLKQYRAGETVKVTFWGAHPKNNFRNGDTFLKVQKRIGNQWVTIRTDNDIDTEYHWERSGLASSLITIVWRINKEIQTGTYRIAYYGDAKSLLNQSVTPFVGYSSEFTIK